MAYRINPAFHRWAAEAAIIGRVVVAFGELEYLMTLVAGRCVAGKEADKRFFPMKALYRLRAKRGRRPHAPRI
jgi:hypothetical protein